MPSVENAFELHCSLTGLEQGLELIHHSLERLRAATGRPRGDSALLLFEVALGEIGGNVLTHGRPASSREAVQYTLRYDGESVEASFTDHGLAAHDHLSREMPGPDSEDGRGLVLARSVLDVLGYERDGDVNRWRLVKRL